MRPGFSPPFPAALLIILAACSLPKSTSLAAPTPPLASALASTPNTKTDTRPTGGTITGLKLVKKLNVPAGPKSLRVLPDGKRVMTCNLYGHQVTFIDAQTYEILRKVPVGGEPVECTFTRGGKYAWVSLYGSERVGATSVVVVIDTETYQIVARIPAGRVPKVVAESPDGKWVYAANWLSESITVMDAEKLTRVKDVPVGRVPRGICFAPDGKLAYVCIMGGHSLAVIDVEQGHRKVRDIETGYNPRHVCVSQDGKLLYVALNASGTLIKIDRATETIIGRAKTGTQARSTSLSIDDRYAFVCNYEDNNLGVVDLEQMKQLFTVKTDVHPIGVTTMPDGRYVWVSNYRPSTVYVFEIEYAAPGSAGVPSVRIPDECYSTVADAPSLGVRASRPHLCWGTGHPPVCPPDVIQPSLTRRNDLVTPYPALKCRAKFNCR